MPNSPAHKSFGAENAIVDYVENLFRPQDAILAGVRTRAEAAKMPPIHVGPFDGLHLEVLARAIGAKKIVEIGTLAGYSGLCLTRALPVDGRLYTFEYEPKHAEVARETFRLGGVDKKVTLYVGAALDNLAKIEKEGPFDLVFIDADKDNYPNYLAWAARHLRIGGVALCDNAFAWGLLTLPPNAPELQEPKNSNARAAIEKTNAALADPKGPWRSTMLPTGEGLAMGVKVR